MGSKQSVLERDDSMMEEEEQPCNCFFLGKPNVRSSSSDPMGTPLPGTPMHQRRKRELILEEARKNPVMMSTYGGLEKETEAFYKKDPTSSTNRGNGKSNEPQVYEGQVRAHEARRRRRQRKNHSCRFRRVACFLPPSLCSSCCPNH